MVESEVLIRTARGTGVLAVQSVANAILGALFFMFMARILTKAEMGVYGAVTLAYTVAVIAGSLGMDYAASRFIPYLHGRGEYDNAKLAAKHIILLSSSSAGLLTLFYFILSQPFSDSMLGSPAYASVFQIAALLVLASILGFTARGFMQGLQRFTHLALFRFTAQIARIAVSVGLFLLGLGVAAVFLGWTLFYTMIIVLAAPIIIKGLFKGSNVDKSEGDPIYVKSLLAFSLPMMVFRFTEYASTSMDQFVVLGLVGVSALGTYTVAITGASLVLNIFALPLLSTLTPSMSEIQGRSGMRSVLNAFTHSTRYIALFFIPASLGLAALSPIAIHILAGQEYVEAALPLAITCIGASAYGFSAAAISALMATGKTKKVMLAVSAASAIELAASTILTPLLGVPGAALSRALMYLAMLIILLYLGSKAMPIAFDREAVAGSLTSSTIMALAIYLIALSTGFRILLLPFYLISALAIYFLSLSAMRTLTPSDFQFTLKILPSGDRLLARVERVLNDYPALSKLVKKLLKC
ncbi:MAG: oligosaccharide flippase family protein [Candidatus Geothermarchaeales archaeon]